jgi:hypothetical protein
MLDNALCVAYLPGFLEALVGCSTCFGCGARFVCVYNQACIRGGETQLRKVDVWKHGLKWTLSDGEDGHTCRWWGCCIMRRDW